MRVDDRLPARDRKRMEDTRRTTTVLTQRREERRAIALPDTTQKAQVQLERALARVKHAPEVAAKPRGDGLNRALAPEVQVELRAQLTEAPADQQSPLISGAVHEVLAAAVLDEMSELGVIVPGPEREASTDDAGLKVEVEEHRDQGVVVAGGHDDLVNELVVRAAQAAQLPPQHLLPLRAHLLDDQDLEVGPRRRRPLACRHVAEVRVRGRALRRWPTRAAIGVCRQLPIEFCDPAREALEVSGHEHPPRTLVAPIARERPRALDRLQQIEKSADLFDQPIARTALSNSSGEAVAHLLQAAPRVHPHLPEAVVGERIEVRAHDGRVQVDSPFVISHRRSWAGG